MLSYRQHSILGHDAQSGTPGQPHDALKRRDLGVGKGGRGTADGCCRSSGDDGAESLAVTCWAGRDPVIDAGLSNLILR